jgi:hypothetical protein
MVEGHELLLIQQVEVRYEGLSFELIDVVLSPLSGFVRCLYQEHYLVPSVVFKHLLLVRLWTETYLLV